MHGQPSEIRPAHLDLADMDAGANLTPSDGIASTIARAHRTAAGRTVERREEPVPRRHDLPAAEAVAARRGRPRGAGRARPATAGRPARAASLVELTMSVNSNVVSIRSGSAPVRAPVRNSSTSSSSSSIPSENARWSVAWQLDEPRTLDHRRGQARLVDGHDLVACPVEHEGGHADRGQDVGDVGLHCLPVVVPERAGPDGVALEARELPGRSARRRPGSAREAPPRSHPSPRWPRSAGSPRRSTPSASRRPGCAPSSA